MKKVVFITSFFIISFIINAQPWLDKLYSNNLKKNGSFSKYNFYDVQEAFNSYWKDKNIEKGKGWKQFKRWEWFNQYRIDEKGFINKNSLYYAWIEKNQKFPNSIIRNNANWKSLGPTKIPGGTSPMKGLGRLNCITVDPSNSDIIWVGSPSGGLWKSTNGGVSWTSNTDFLDGLGISSILISPTNSSIMYLATGDFDHNDTYSIGILKSIDGGLTWFLPSSDSWIKSSNAYKLSMHSSDENVIFACSQESLLKTTDGGINWINMTINFKSVFYDLIVDKTNSNVLFAACYDLDLNTNFIIKSYDAGESWIRLTNGLPIINGSGRIALAQASSNSEIVYSVFTNNNGSLFGIYKTIDGGNNWELTCNSPNMLGWTEDGSDLGGQAWYDLALIVHPTDPKTVYLGGINIWKSLDGGFTWKINAQWHGGYKGNIPVVHADIHAFEFINDTGSLLSACDGGLFKTSDGGTNWIDLSDGLGIQQFYRIGGSLQFPDLIFGGAQDCGTSLYDSDEPWINYLEGDGMECAIDYSNHKIGYASLQNGHFAKTTDGGNLFKDINNGILEKGAWITPFVIHPTNPEILYRTTTKVYKSTNRGDLWQPISEALDYDIFTRELDLLAVSKSNPEIIYTCSANYLFKTTDNGNSWNKFNLPPYFQYPSSLAIHPNNPNIVFITSSNINSSLFGNFKVSKSIDGGNSWLNISGEIPKNLPVNCIIIQEDSPEDIYIGTDIGVFYSSNGGLEWQNYSNYLPNVIINELEINIPSGKIRAATFGRGLWESPLNKILVSVHTNDNILPSPFLNQNYPNPFNPLTTIKYSIPKNCLVKITVNDLLGQEISVLVNEQKDPGIHEITFNAQNLSSGVYFYTLQTDNFITAKKFVLLK